MRDDEKCPKKDHPARHPKDFFPWVDEVSRLTDNLDPRSIRIVQYSDGWIEPMALEPTVRKCLGICRARARNSYTQWWFPIIDDGCAGETLLSWYGKPNFIFYEIVGNMVP